MIDLNTINQKHLWYLIGLIATDGSLSIDRRHISITSKDQQILGDIKEAFSLRGKIGKKSSGAKKEKIYSYIQIGDVAFYSYLLSIGLTPTKSITLGEIKVEDKFFDDFLRGVIDGDGCIFSWKHATNGGLQASLRIASAAPKFASWLFFYISNRYKVPGQLVVYPERFRNNPVYNLKYGKLAAEVILKACYYPNCLVNIRKLDQANALLKDKPSRKYTPRWRNW